MIFFQEKTIIFLKLYNKTIFFFGFSILTLNIALSNAAYVAYEESHVFNVQKTASNKLQQKRSARALQFTQRISIASKIIFKLNCVP